MPANAVDRFLAQKAQRARLVFALDATGSRQPTWDMACQLQASMFQEAANLAAVEVQLVYYRGLVGFDGECRASKWMPPAGLIHAMRSITCRSGETQIGKVLAHVANETVATSVGALVFIGDACEESPDVLIARAGRLGVPAFMFQEGGDENVEAVFRAIACASKGAYCRFDAGAARQLGELLRAVVAFILGGTQALAARQDAGAVKLLAQLK